MKRQEEVEEEEEEILTAMQQSCILMAKEMVSCFPMNKAEKDKM